MDTKFYRQTIHLCSATRNVSCEHRNILALYKISERNSFNIILSKISYSNQIWFYYIFTDLSTTIGHYFIMCVGITVLYGLHNVVRETLTKRDRQNAYKWFHWSNNVFGSICFFLKTKHSFPGHFNNPTFRLWFLSRCCGSNSGSSSNSRFSNNSRGKSSSNSSSNSNSNNNRSIKYKQNKKKSKKQNETKAIPPTHNFIFNLSPIFVFFQTKNVCCLAHLNNPTF